MSERKTCLRVLYTINSSPQYILARSPSPVSVTVISHEQAPLPDASRAPALYATATLKRCLDAICRSSPDLTRDSTRDFSLYLLDPLESNSAPAPVNISHVHGDSASSTSSAGTENPRWVAVGLGLMSQALMTSDSDSVSVTGTLVKQPNGQEALEVVFALRETVAVKQRAWDVPSSLQSVSSSQESVVIKKSKQIDLERPQWYSTSQTSSSTNLSRSTSSSDLTRETVALIQMRGKAKVRARKNARHSNTPITESDKLMNVADTYIGPLKKKGRPKMTNADYRPAKTQGHHITSAQLQAQKEVIVLDASDNETNSSSQASDAGGKRKCSSQQPRPPPFTTAPLIRNNSQQTVADLDGKKIEGSFIDPLSLLAVDSTLSKTLLTALATIDSTENNLENPQNTAVIAVLKRLLAIYTKPTATPKTTPYVRTPTPEVNVRHHSQSSRSHSDGVVLDKENVNPATSRNSLRKTGLDKFSDPLPFAMNSSKEQSMQGLRPSTRENEINWTNDPREITSRSVPAVRKRTLSEFMDEKESRGRNKGKEKETIRRHDLRRDSSLQQSEMLVAEAMRHYPQVLAANLPRLGQPSNYYRIPSDPWTSPPRGRIDNPEIEQCSNLEGAGPYSSKYLSSNHQTVSASSPVRSKEMRKKYVVPEWARTNTATRPRLSEEAKRAMEEAEARKREERNTARRKFPTKPGKIKPGDSTDELKADQIKPAGQPSCPQFTIAKKCDLSHGPISASSDGPMISFPLVSTPTLSSPPPQPLYNPQTPKTPSKGCVEFINGEDGSLFTPITGGGSLFGSAVSFHSDRGTPPSVLTSPLGNRKKAKISSTQSIFTGSALHAWWNTSSPKTSTDSEEHERNSNLGKESEEGDAFDCSPGSLPMASSDIDDGSYSQSTGEAGNNIEEDPAMQPVKQHWAGLPPSSPPPPSSPMLFPVSQTDEYMDELPIATSDSEVDADMTTFEPQGTPSNVTSPEAEASQTPMNLTDGDFTALFSTENNPSSSYFQLSSSTTLDLLDQFTTVNAQSDDISAVCGSSTNTDLQTMFQNGIGDLDFTEFWETFKPMVSEQDNVDQSFAELFGMEDSQLLLTMVNSPMECNHLI